MDQFVGRLTEEEKKELRKKLTAPNPSVNFSSASIADCTRQDGLGLNLDYVTGPTRKTIHIPEDFSVPEPSNHLCEHLRRVMTYFAQDHEAAKRSIIDAILLEALDSNADEKLKAFCKVKNDWTGSGFGYTGNVDYMMGSVVSRNSAETDSFVIVVQAKNEWPDEAVFQVLAEAGCLLKRRLEVKKNTPVFACLSNGKFFRFYAINVDMVVYSSGAEIRLKEGPLGTYRDSSELAEIIRWFNWTISTGISPSASVIDISNSRNTKLRECMSIPQRN